MSKNKNRRYLNSYHNMILFLLYLTLIVTFKSLAKKIQLILFTNPNPTEHNLPKPVS